MKFTDRYMAKDKTIQATGHTTVFIEVMVDSTGRIRHIETGFLGHQNDAQQFNLMST